MSKKKNINDLLVAANFDDVMSCPFKNDKERIKYVSNAYRNISVAKAFSIFYGLEISNDIKSNRSINNVNLIEVGKIYTGSVKEFTKTSLLFEIPGVKEEIVCKENFSSCIESIQNYLITHDNKLMFEVREKQNGKFIVSVINAYYKAWQNMVNKAIEREDAVHVHIDDLVKGGYICHTVITTLTELTGQEYTSSVFIPGSHIVLNIEQDFEKWIGQDVIIVPQKFVEFRKDIHTGLTENSLVGSRKRVLQIMGTQNMYDIYQYYTLSQKEGVNFTPQVFDGIVTGIINSNKKTGIFVEINGKYITGLMPCEASDLLDYHPGDSIRVKIKEFEVQEGKDSFILNKKNQIIKCNVRPVLEIC